jgi:hypothetical protein
MRAVIKRLAYKAMHSAVMIWMKPLGCSVGELGQPGKGEDNLTSQSGTLAGIEKRIPGRNP